MDYNEMIKQYKYNQGKIALLYKDLKAKHDYYCADIELSIMQPFTENSMIVSNLREKLVALIFKQFNVIDILETLADEYEDKDSDDLVFVMD